MTAHDQTQLAALVMVVAIAATIGLAVGVWLAGRRDRGRS
jgi:hypothetical protein